MLRTAGAAGQRVRSEALTSGAVRLPSLFRRSPGVAELPPFGASGLPITGYEGMTPPDRIALGAFLCAIVIGLPAGIPLLVIGVRQLRRPLWRMRTYTKWAAKDPAHADQLITRAVKAMPGSPELAQSLAALHFNRGEYVAALPHLRRWAAESDGDARVHGALASAALQCGDVQEAIDTLESVAGDARLSSDARALVAAHLAYAHLCAGDPQLAFTVLGRIGGLDGRAMQESLFYRAIAKYFLGYVSLAIADLDRLRNFDPPYAGLDATRDAMESRTYQLLLPDGTALIPVPQPRGSTAAVVQRLPAGPHCATCGARMAEDDVVCRYCGALLASSDAGEPHARSGAPF